MITMQTKFNLTSAYKLKSKSVYTYTHTSISLFSFKWNSSMSFLL